MFRGCLPIIAAVAMPGPTTPLWAQVDESAAVRKVVESLAANIQAKNLAGNDTLFARGRGAIVQLHTSGNRNANQ